MNETAARVAGGSFRLVVSPASEASLLAIAKRIEKQIDSILWKGKVMSPTLRSKLFCDRQMHPGDLYATPGRLAGDKAGSVKKLRRSMTYTSGTSRIDERPLGNFAGSM